MTKKKSVVPRKKVARKQSAPKESAIRLLKATMATLERLQQDAQMFLNQSAQDMKEINGLKNRLSNAEGVNRSMYARLNALEARPEPLTVLNVGAIKQQIASLQGVLDSIQFRMPTAFLRESEVQRLRKIIAAMA